MFVNSDAWLSLLNGLRAISLVVASFPAPHLRPTPEGGRHPSLSSKGGGCSNQHYFFNPLMVLTNRCVRATFSEIDIRFQQLWRLVAHGVSDANQMIMLGYRKSQPFCGLGRG